MSKKHQKNSELLRCLSKEDKILFLSELLQAIDRSISEGNFDAISLCIENWEDTAELLSIPGLKDRVWAQFTKLKDTGCIS
ncbi:MAG: hypothetical protein SRB1_00379 [Desulfobacteraceae bacterium Eth-SRB1]|nr:MAG: hypothetical protein SRB1_00379 [Desulfobacteraceae bacterium Eth-SRB1]